MFVDEEIRSGQLLELSSEDDTGGYYIVTRPGVLRPPVRAFVKWLKRLAATEVPERADLRPVLALKPTTAPRRRPKSSL